MTLVERIVALHGGLGGVRHAFGGALALAWCTAQARGTIDIDVNVFVPATASVLNLMPPGVRWNDDDVLAFVRDGQIRLWWDDTPVDLFCNTTPFHEAAARRVQTRPFGGAEVPFLACRDLAVFKAHHNRTKDWADLEAMAEAGSLDVEAVLGVLVAYLGGTDERIERLRSLRG